VDWLADMDCNCETSCLNFLAHSFSYDVRAIGITICQQGMLALPLDVMTMLCLLLLIIAKIVITEALLFPRSFIRAERHLSASCLFALGKAQNKQAELARKLELAKRQQRTDADLEKLKRIPDENTKDELRLEKTHSEFAALLAKHAPPVAEPKRRTPSVSSNILLDKIARNKAADNIETPSSSIEKKRKMKRRKKISSDNQTTSEEEDISIPLHEGDEAKRRHFESLICSTTKLPLGPMSAVQLVPWVPPYLSRSLIVLADPRKRSSDLRAGLQALISLTSASTPTGTAGSTAFTVIAITSDTPEETARYVSIWRRNGCKVPSTGIRSCCWLV
jgi:hypothetical protein